MATKKTSKKKTSSKRTPRVHVETKPVIKTSETPEGYRLPWGEDIIVHRCGSRVTVNPGDGDRAIPTYRELRDMAQRIMSVIPVAEIASRVDAPTFTTLARLSALSSTMPNRSLNRPIL